MILNNNNSIKLNQKWKSTHTRLEIIKQFQKIDLNNHNFINKCSSKDNCIFIFLNYFVIFKYLFSFKI